MNEQIFKGRTFQLAIRVIALVDALPRKVSADVIGRQLLRAATSVGANYRAACRGRSVADVIAKLGIVEEEADETIFWLDLTIAVRLFPEPRLRALRQEAEEILAMTVASIKTLRKRGATPRQSKIQNLKSKIGV